MPADNTELRIDLGAARDQGPRPTCLSFSLSDIHRSAIGFSELLSPESLHRLAAQRAKKHHNVGLTLQEAIEGLSHHGQTTEPAWPYNSKNATEPACTFHKAKAVYLPFDHMIIAAAIGAGKPISLIIDIDTAFFRYKGAEALDLVANTQIQGRHAVVICGLRTVGGGSEYLVKNSWGVGWGDLGHAWLTSGFVSARSPLLLRI